MRTDLPHDFTRRVFDGSFNCLIVTLITISPPSHRLPFLFSAALTLTSDWLFSLSLVLLAHSVYLCYVSRWRDGASLCRHVLVTQLSELPD